MTNFLCKLFIKNCDDVENPDVREKHGLLSGIVGIILNVCLFAGKLITGIISGSVSVQADAFNNLSDAGSSILTMVGFKLANKPVDKDHPFGHGRMEYLTGFIVAMLILLVGAELLKTSVSTLIHGAEKIDLSLLTFIILGISLCVKFWMYIFNTKLSKRINSAAIKATAVDSISDCVSTGVVFIASIFTYYTSWYFIDAIVGALVAAFIFYSGFKSAKETTDLLLGVAPDREYTKSIADFILSQEGIVGIHDLVVHNYGPGRQMISVHTEIPDTMNINDAHELVDKVEQLLRIKYNCHAVIHMDPIVVGDEKTDEIKRQVQAIVKSIDKSFDIHDFRMVAGTNASNLIFDVTRTPDSKFTDKEILDYICTEVKKIDKKYSVVAVVEQSYCI